MDTRPSQDAHSGTGLADQLHGWSPGPVTTSDTLRAGPVAALSAVLDQREPVSRDGDPLPPLWHWLHFLEWPTQRELGADGHPLQGHFLPPLPDRRRMFAGGRVEFTAALRTGDPAERTSSLAGVRTTHGRTGELAFVTVRSELTQHGRVCAVEEQDYVYRSGESSSRSAQFGHDPGDVDPPDAAWQLTLRPDPPLLFRFSALTANAHRIHYDAPYATGTEGYPCLVVHGPLLVLLMLELARRNAPRRAVRSLSYRLHQPLFAGEQLAALGEPAGDGAALRVAGRRAARFATAEVGFD